MIHQTFYDPAPILDRMPPGASARQIANILGTTRRQVCHMRAGRFLRARNADRFATALDLHPTAIW